MGCVPLGCPPGGRAYESERTFAKKPEARMARLACSSQPTVDHFPADRYSPGFNVRGRLLGRGGF